MARALLLLGLVALVAVAAAAPEFARSQEDIDNYRKFLEDTQKDNAATRIKPVVPEGVEVNAEEISGKYQGDIVLDDFQIEEMVKAYAEGRNAYTWPNTKWPDNTVVWEFGEDEFGPMQMAAIEEGIADIERHTCVKFRKRQPGDSAYVRLTGAASGCFAHVGYWSTRGVHTLNLARNTPGVGCFRHTTIIHEWLHILGFLHMQSTHNRDEYVRIMWENIQPGTENNFEKYDANLVDNLKLEYEYASCMHYGPFGFTINGEPTIIPVNDDKGQMGQRERVTALDWQRTNRHYNCPGAWN